MRPPSSRIYARTYEPAPRHPECGPERPPAPGAAPTAREDAMTANEMAGGEALARMRRAFDSGPMFGMGGFQLLPCYDAARRLGLKHYLINDERCGAFAADAYAKVTGRVGG